ncbi:YdeI/OmpD-associated family protein, partial [Sphingobacterium sp.]|uniref:YdeI/OmpD-associated family protein n=1 Tax=Sphingobacterium sp. TaxID=341027 RepID=UPI00289AEC29
LFLETLQADKLFNDSFQALTPGKRKEYIEYIEEAKQEKTKMSRMEKIKPLIFAKKGLNDKYK